MKFDDKKVRLDLIEPEFLIGIGQALTNGVEKYGENDWKNTEDGIKRYYGAVLRHSTAVRMGEWVDTKSGLPHVYHIAANLMFIDYFYRRNPSEEFPYLRRFGDTGHTTNRQASRSYWSRLWDYTKTRIGFPRRSR